MKKSFLLIAIFCLIFAGNALAQEEVHTLNLATNTIEGHAGFVADSGLLLGATLDSPFYLRANVGLDAGQYPLGIQLGARFKFGSWLDIIPLGMLDQVTVDEENIKGGGIGAKVRAKIGGIETEGTVVKEWFQLEEGDGWRVRWDLGYRYEDRFFEWKGAGIISTKNWVHGLIPNMASFEGQPDFGGLMQFRLGEMKYIELNLEWLTSGSFLATICGRMSLEGFAAVDKNQQKKGGVFKKK